jgi:charged multivesicular body protein 7
MRVASGLTVVDTTRVLGAGSTWLTKETRLTLHFSVPATMSSSSVLLSSCSTYASTSKSRLQSLYSDISRQKHSNPTSYHAYVDWWQRTLEELVSRGWQTETTSGQKGKDTDAQDAELENQSNKLVFGVRRAIGDRLRYDGVGKPLGLASTIVRVISFPPSN